MSPVRDRFSFRDTSPYSKTKTVRMNIQKVHRDSTLTYKDSSGGDRKSIKRAKSIVKNADINDVEDLKNKVEYKEKKETILKDLNVVNTVIQTSQPI